MGKKSKRNKNNNGVPPRKGLPNIYDTICRLTHASKYDEVLEVESKYRHLDSFSDDPTKDAYVLWQFGCVIYYDSAVKDEICFDRAIDYFERAKERVEEAEAGDRREFKHSFKAGIEEHLALLYSDAGRDMEGAISSHRCFLANCNRDEITANYMIQLSDNFDEFNEYEYTIEVLEGSMDVMETFEDEDKAQAESYLVRAYFECYEFLKAKATDETLRSTDISEPDCCVEVLSGRIEDGLCNYQAAVVYFRKAVAWLQTQETQEYDDMSRICSSLLAGTLLRHSADNEAEAFAIFQEQLHRCVDPLRRDELLLRMGTWYKELHKWDQSIQALHQLYLSATRPDSTMLPQANTAMAQTYLEQYCTDTTLDIDQRTQILRQATEHSNQVDEVSTTDMHLTQAQLFYCNGDKDEAYRHLELYLDDTLAYCKISCYTCEQRVRHGSVPFTCASCMVASYCGRNHQKMTYKNQRICHKVLCPLLGYWRMAKKKQKEQKKQKKQKGLTNEDRCEYVRVFDTFFESIGPHMKQCGSIPSYTMID
jgi:tetratricopeptide (TPR) repeat protein